MFSIPLDQMKDHYVLSQPEELEKTVNIEKFKKAFYLK
jgi:hypothetical protein